MLKPIPLHYTESSRLIVDEELDPEMVAKTKNQAHWRGIVNLLASILGTGLLSMPGACKSSGLFFFLSLSLLAAAACHTTACFLVRTVKFLTPTRGGEDATYAGLASHVLGSRGEKAIQIGLVLQQVGACVGYIVVIGDVFSPLLRLYFDMNNSETFIRSNYFLYDQELFKTMMLLLLCVVESHIPRVSLAQNSIKV